MGEKVESFCEYGTGVALQLGAGGALWDQNWGEEAWNWYECDAAPNVGFLNKNVVGQLGTTTAAPPQIDADWILRFDFGGWFVLTAPDDDGPVPRGERVRAGGADTQPDRYILARKTEAG